jgi:Mn2+/Fe2+ NRAMP family transporter
MRKPFLALVLVFAITLSAAAQNTTIVAGWDRVVALPVRSQIYVYDRTTHKRCYLKSADAETLVCSNGGDLVYRRSEIVSIKLSHRVRSAWTAEGTAYAVLAVIAFSARNKTDNSLEAAAILGLVDLITLIAVPFLGHRWDFMRTTIYTAPQP